MAILSIQEAWKALATNFKKIYHMSVTTSERTLILQTNLVGLNILFYQSRDLPSFLRAYFQFPKQSFNCEDCEISALLATHPRAPAFSDRTCLARRGHTEHVSE